MSFDIYFGAHVGGYQMLSFPCNSCFDQEFKAHLKMLKVTKDENEKSL